MFLLDPVIFPWDAAILLLVGLGLGTAALARIWLRRHRRPRWKRFLVGAFGAFGLFGAVVVFYGSFIEPQIITVTRHTVDLPLHAPLKIAVLSDFHVGPYKSKAFVRRVVQKTNALLPDLVLLAGDYTFDDRQDIHALAPLRDLRPSLGVFAVLGNHDHGRFLSLTRELYELEDHSDEIGALLSDLGVSVLTNAHTLLRVGNDDVAILGVDDVWTEGSSAAKALEGVPAGTVAILVAHSPDILLDPDAARANLITVGHTHGGQIRLPWFGPVPMLPTRVGKKYDQGLFAIDEDTTMAVTRGLGETLARARLLAWPEIMLLEARPPAAR